MSGKIRRNQWNQWFGWISAHSVAPGRESSSVGTCLENSRKGEEVKDETVRFLEPRHTDHGKPLWKGLYSIKVERHRQNLCRVAQRDHFDYSASKRL